MRHCSFLGFPLWGCPTTQRNCWSYKCDFWGLPCPMPEPCSKPQGWRGSLCRGGWRSQVPKDKGDTRSRVASMSAVRSFPCRASQENNLHLDSALVVQIFWARNLGCFPWTGCGTRNWHYTFHQRWASNKWSLADQVKAAGKQRCTRSASTMIVVRGVEPSNRADPPAIRSLCGDIPLLPGCDIVEVWGP
jgi:hypothetical protein